MKYVEALDVSDGHIMGESGFDHLTRRIRLLRRPVPEARPEPMRHGGHAEFFAQPVYGK